MCKNGYYNTNTSDIAKFANVSTGIIYQYFNDKKEIFIEGIKNYSEGIMFPILDILKNNDLDFDNLENLLDKLLTIFIKKHTLSKKEHEEMIALSHMDDEIQKIFNNKEIETTKIIADALSSHGFSSKYLFEKVHIIIGIVENYCHEVVYHKHELINYDTMKQEVIKIITQILKK